MLFLKVFNFFSGKKTHTIAVLGILGKFGLCLSGDISWISLFSEVLPFLGMSTLRAGIGKR